MPFSIDPPTMFLALVASTMAAVFLLLWCFWLNRGERSLLWLAVGFAFGSVANLMLAGRGALPEWVAIDVGIAMLLTGISCLWVSARVFNGRPVGLWIPVGGPALWLVACSVPAIYANLDARVATGSLISAIYYLLAAREFMVKDGLLTRYAMSAVLVVHAIVVLLRIPLVLSDGVPGLAAARPHWFGISALEAAVIIQMLAFLMVSLTKERVERRLRTAALTDPLTGIGNRRAFFEWSAAAITEDSGRPFATVIFDLDRFKEINDRFGHPTGDAVIQAFANAAAGCVGTAGFVARLGGEEFAVALPDMTGLEACLMADEIGRAFRAEVVAMARSGLAASASAGVAQSPSEPYSIDDLLTSADRALYAAKGLGGGQVCVDGSAAGVAPRAA